MTNTADLNTPRHLHCLRLYVAALLAHRGGEWTAASVAEEIKRHSPLIGAKLYPLPATLAPEVVQATAAEAIAEAQHYRSAGVEAIIPFQQAANFYACITRGLSEPAAKVATDLLSRQLVGKLTANGVETETARTWIAATILHGHARGEEMNARGAHRIGHA